MYSLKNLMVWCSMCNMFLMLHRMAVRAKNHEIAQFIIMPIFINMMNTKNIFTSIKTAKLAFFNHASTKHTFSYRSKFCFPYFMVAFIYTFLRTKFSFMRLRIHKFFVTMVTGIFSSSIVNLCFIATFIRTIFCFATPSGYMRKLFFTYKTICYNLYRSIFIFAFSGAKF